MSFIYIDTALSIPDSDPKTKDWWGEARFLVSIPKPRLRLVRSNVFRSLDRVYVAPCQ